MAAGFRNIPHKQLLGQQSRSQRSLTYSGGPDGGRSGGVPRKNSSGPRQSGVGTSPLRGGADDLMRQTYPLWNPDGPWRAYNSGIQFTLTKNQSFDRSRGWAWHSVEEAWYNYFNDPVRSGMELEKMGKFGIPAHFGKGKGFEFLTHYNMPPDYNMASAHPYGWGPNWNSLQEKDMWVTNVDGTFTQRESHVIKGPYDSLHPAPVGLTVLNPNDLTGEWAERWEYLRSYLTLMEGWDQSMIEQVRVDIHSGFAVDATLAPAGTPGGAPGGVVNGIYHITGHLKYQIMPGRKIVFENDETGKPKKPISIDSWQEKATGVGGTQHCPHDDPCEQFDPNCGDPNGKKKGPERNGGKKKPAPPQTLRHTSRQLHYKEKEVYPLLGVNLSKRKWR